MKLHRDPDDYKVQIDELMELSLEAGNVPTDLFVLDGIVAVRINDNRFRFFIEPLVVRDPIEPLALDDGTLDDGISSGTTSGSTSTIPFDYTKLLAYCFSPIEEYTRAENVTLYGVRFKTMVKIEYTLDEEEMMMRENVTYFYAPEFNGT